MCVVWIETSDGWVEHDRTEMVKNSLNPEFSKRISIEYHFEQLQKLKFSLYDIDDPTGPLKRQDFLGEATCTLGQIVHSGRLEFSLAPRCGRIIIESQDMSKNRDFLDLCFRAQQLANSRHLSEPNPFLEFHRISPEGHKTLIHRTESVKHTRQPDWAKFTVPLCLFEMDGAESKILIECFDKRRSGDHKLIGQVQLSSRYLYRSPKYFELIRMVIFIRS